MFDHLTCQDVVSFTGSAETSQKLQCHPIIAREAVRFVAERDFLNAAILAPDAKPGTPEFDLFVKEVAKEMTVKAGQKCTAIRRAFAPSAHVDAVISALRERLAKVRSAIPNSRAFGWDRSLASTSGAMCSLTSRSSERKRNIVAGDPDNFSVEGADKIRGAFLPPLLLHCAESYSRDECSLRSKRSGPFVR